MGKKGSQYAIFEINATAQLFCMLELYQVETSLICLENIYHQDVESDYYKKKCKSAKFPHFRSTKRRQDI